MLVSFLSVSQVQGAEIRSFNIHRAGDGYSLRTIALIEAPLDSVWRVLTDYPALQKVSLRIIESELVSASPDGVAPLACLACLACLASWRLPSSGRECVAV